MVDSILVFLGLSRHWVRGGVDVGSVWAFCGSSRHLGLHGVVVSLILVFLGSSRHWALRSGAVGSVEVFLGSSRCFGTSWCWRWLDLGILGFIEGTQPSWYCKRQKKIRDIMCIYVHRGHTWLVNLLFVSPCSFLCLLFTPWPQIQW